MRTTAEILEAAARLSPAELQRLKEGVASLQRQQNALRVETRKREYRLERLSDGEYRDLLRRSIAIEEDLGFQIHLHLFRMDREIPEPDFPRVDAVLSHLTGPCERHSDWSRGSFSFPFLVHFTSESGEVEYLLEVYNSKDSIYYPFRKVMTQDDERLRTPTFHPPIESELSRDDMNRFLLHFQDFLIDKSETIGTKWLTPFVRGVKLVSIVYGFSRGDFFEQRFKNDEEYEAALNQYRKQVAVETGSPSGSDGLDRVR